MVRTQAFVRLCCGKREFEQIRSGLETYIHCILGHRSCSLCSQSVSLSIECCQRPFCFLKPQTSWLRWPWAINNQCGAVSPGNPIVVSIFLLGLCDMANNQSEKSLYTKSISWHCWAGYMGTWVAWCWPVSLPLLGCGYGDLGCMVLGVKLPNNSTTALPMSIIMQLLRFVSTSSLWLAPTKNTE
jgi:hypothetical protein